MNRHILRTALGRAGPSPTARSFLSQNPLSTPTPTSFALFSTTSARGNDSSSSGNGNSNNDRPHQTAAVDKLAQLGQRRATNNNDADSPSEALHRRRAARRGGIDARSLRVSPLAGTASTTPTSSSSSSSSASSSAPRILNVRSLRGGLRGGFRGGRSASLRRGAGPGLGESGPGGDAPLGGPEFGRPRLGGGRAGFGFGGKLVWSPEEQAVLDRLDKGEVVPYEPKLTLDSLSGYGAAIATDAALGQVESAIRTMRLMTGGMAFNSDSGVTTDLDVVNKRARQGLPIFLHSKGEKDWIERGRRGMRVVEADPATKKAIIDAAVRGKYEAPGFAEISDVKATMANYHSRTFTYSAADSKKFIDKVLSLLPAQAGSKPGAQAKQ
ncbi:f79d67be-3683-49c0-9c75-bdbfee244369 [Thermothielavioides terrestris]|uniref:F79d67be-3683-49c0-9c75-bdbfee244369 n=1 Tax=Thermothielavioides terrestris TaxID=2587410 RepID=A0A3S4EXE8_9PEZI|nr:f79d67be-3683-49c0-9c75-bdbfee244369 [Thermothielavioides terrestris]